MKLQKVWRGKIARNKIVVETEIVVVKKTEQKKEEFDFAKVMREDEERRRIKAAIFIQRYWRRSRFRKNELKRL